MTEPPLLSRLHKAGPKLPPKLRALVLREGASLLPGLLAMLSNDELFVEGRQSDGFGPVHAVDLLCELRAPEAIPALLATFFREEWNVALHDPIIRGLQRFGAAALEPVLAALDDARDEHDRAALCEVLAKIGVRDERLFQEFCNLFEADPVYGALTLAEYGDRRATALVAEVLDSSDSRSSDEEFGPRDILQIAAAYRSLGGQFTATMEARIGKALAEAEKIRQQHLQSGTKVTAAKVGRNDPCPCGSGKKFKKCCAATAP